VRLKGLGQLKNPMTSSGIEPATFRLIAYCLNQLRYGVPPYSVSSYPFYGFGTKVSNAGKFHLAKLAARVMAVPTKENASLATLQPAQHVSVILAHNAAESYGS
jgi:hypothetical protein